MGQLFDQLNTLVKKLTLNDGSLSEKDLELIAGGSLRSWLVGLGLSFGGSIGAFACALGVGLKMD